LEAAADGTPIRLGAPKQRAFLAYLLLNRGHVVAIDELIEELWPEEPPASAPHALHVYASELRKAIGRDAITRKQHGYVARVEPESVDAEVFERKLEEGRRELSVGSAVAGSELLREALSLWRGPALVDIQPGPRTRAAAAALNDLRLSGLEDRIEAELGLGRHADLVPELEMLVTEHPLRERLHAQLMLALYRTGRQADALAAYRSAQQLLRAELGLEPGRALQDLERAILNHDPVLEPASQDRRRRDALPVAVTSLIGRRNELEQVLQMLRSPDSRLVTITGTGGIGKTRLALESARLFAECSSHEPVFVELAAISRPDLVAHAIAATLGVQQRSGQTALEAVATALEQSEALLVLDNFEHVLDATPVVSALLTATTSLKVLVTSRTRLHVYGEHEFALGPLDVPGSETERGAEALARFDAVELFVSRARAASPGFDLDRMNAREVGEICLRLDGLPLAIELAAARMKAFTPRMLLDRLGEALRVLVDGPRDVPERHRSLRATLDWSYGLLTEPEARLFRRLSVFHGSFTLDACRTVCEGDLSTLESLLEHNLVRRQTTEDRFSMLETIQEYALHKLIDCDEHVGARRQHVDYFVTFAERAEPALRSPEQLEWLSLLDAAQPNIWAAFGWGLEAAGDAPLRIGAALWRYWEARGGIGEARQRLDEALARLPEASSDVRARAFFASGRMALRQGDLDHASASFEAGRSLFAEIGDLGGMAVCTAGLGWVAHVVGPIEAAVEQCHEAVELARRSGATWIVADALNNLGVALRSAGDLARSREALEESLLLRRQLGELEGITAALNGLALVAMAEDDFDQAERLFDEAFSLSEERGDVFYVAAQDVVRAYLAFGRGELERATAFCSRALASCTRHGYVQFSAYALETLAGIAAAEGRPGHAGRLLGSALAISERLGAGREGAARHSGGVAYDWEARAVRRVLDRARREMGTGAWEAAIAEGRTLTVADALASVEEWTTIEDRDVGRAPARKRKTQSARVER
jgi:predicted ATPase/DNA-binding SARP family transcriptional activator